MSADPTPTPAPANEWTIRKILEWTTGHLKKHGSDSPRLDAEILLAHARGCQRIQLYTAYDEPLSESVRATMRELVQRRAKAEPVAYLVGHREFFSLDFRVTHDVLIPRPDTETLVLEVIDGLKQRASAKNESVDAEVIPANAGIQSPASATAKGESKEPEPPIRILDLCTGSGCVAIAVARHVLANKLNAKIVATDLSPAALSIARENATRNQVDSLIEFFEGDLFAALPAGSRFDIIASNPPYVPTGEIDQLEPEVSQHEPRLALDGGASGFDVMDRLMTDAPRFAASGGLFLMELSPEQAETATQKLSSSGSYQDVSVRKDLGGRPRVMRARFLG